MSSRGRRGKSKVNLTLVQLKYYDYDDEESDDDVMIY